MFGTAIDTAIGLVLVFLLFSIMLSILMEIISGVLGLRAKALENGIAKLIQNPKPAATFLGPVSAMFGAHKQAADVPAADIPASALLYQKVYNHPLVAGTSRTNKPSYVPGPNFASAMVHELGRLGSGSDVSTVTATIDNVKAAVAALPPDNGQGLKTTLETLIGEAGDDLNKLRSGIEGWYDSAMDRLSGSYKRFTQLITFIIGLLLAGFCNVDAMAIAHQLYADPALRANLVKMAQTEIKTPPPAPSNQSAAQHPSKTAGSSSAPAASSSQPASSSLAASSAPSSSSSPAASPSPSDTLAPRFNQLAGAELKLDQTYLVGWPRPPGAFDAWVLIGWLITALAALLGSSFWFDTLKTLVNVRNAGPKPDSSTSSAS